MEQIKKKEISKLETPINDTSQTAISRTQFAIARIQGYYQLQAAKTNNETTLAAAKINARARYFQGVATLLGAFGVFGGFIFNLVQETRDVKRLTEKLNKHTKNQEIVLLELSQSYNKLAENLQSQNQPEKSKASRKLP